MRLNFPSTAPPVVFASLTKCRNSTGTGRPRPDCHPTSRRHKARLHRFFSVSAMRAVRAVFAVLHLILLQLTQSAVIRSLWGSNNSEPLFASSGGGTHVYLQGTDLGSAVRFRDQEHAVMLWKAPDQN